MSDRRTFGLGELHSRRAALQSGATLGAVLAAIRLQGAGAAHATPAASEGRAGLLQAQAFGRGNIFPTQGDSPGMPPYTVILWDAADRGVVVANAVRGGGIVPTESLLAALGDVVEAPYAALVAQPAAGSDGAASAENVWLFRLVSGDLGSDPGAVTYQGDVVAPDDAEAMFGVSARAAPEGPQDIGGGYLLVTGLPVADAGFWLTWP
jgi:hypothetical protein